MNFSGNEDLRRRLNELNLEAAKIRLSPQTGFLHFFFENQELMHPQTIPILENMYCVLALFRQRLSDPILEGKNLLEKLLAFEVEGNFPIYLHQYPHCRDRCLSMHMLPIFHALLKDFRSVLGEELIIKIEGITQRIVAHAHKMQKEKKLPPTAEYKFEGFLGILREKMPSNSFEWADYLIALQMMPKSLFVTNERKKALGHWSRTLGIFVNGTVSHPQEGFYPKMTLFDLFMYLQQGVFVRGIAPSNPLLLAACLVTCFDEEEKFLIQEDEAVVSSFVPQAKESFTLTWKEQEMIRSLAIASTKGVFQFQKIGEVFRMIFTYPVEVPDEEGQEELAFYIDAQAKVELFVNGNRSTTFKPSDDVAWHTAQKRLSFSITIVEGEGKIMGHLLKGNRPSQVLKDPFKAYDWKIGLRTLKRDSHLKLQIDCILS
jgi:hypothetical protein